MWTIGVNMEEGRKVGWNVIFFWKIEKFRPREIKTVERWDPFRATDSISCNPYPGCRWNILDFFYPLIDAKNHKRHESRHSRAFPLRKLGAAPSDKDARPPTLPPATFRYPNFRIKIDLSSKGFSKKCRSKIRLFGTNEFPIRNRHPFRRAHPQF